jgi:phage shock protein E
MRYLLLLLFSVLTVPGFSAKPSHDLIIDVRTLEEWNKGHLASAQHIPLQNIAEELMALSIDKNRTVHLYCRTGNRSGKAKTIMQQLGYTNVINAGGMSEASTLLQDSIIGR